MYLKRLFRSIKWLIVFPLFRQQFRNNRLNRELIREYGGENATVHALKRYKTADTLFILAAGQTINNISSKQWGEIKQHDSIGINGFAYHEHVPTYHSFELENQRSPKIIKMFRETSRKILDKIKEYKHTAIIFRQHPVIDNEIKIFIKKLNPYKNYYWNTYDTIPGQTIKDYAYYLRFYNRIGLMKKSDFFPNKGSSLSWVISMAYKLKYKHIVLCGVDLFGDHFYINPEPLNEEQYKTKVTELHLTGDKGANNRIAIQEIIKLWQNEYFIPDGAKLYSGSRFSLLSEIIPPYWEPHHFN